MLKIYNSLNNQKETFTPITDNVVNMYVCGMTVYDYCHLGHARVMVVFDSVVRYLRHQGYDVNYVRNITDIDDKIIQRANENNEPFNELTERFIEAMHEDEKSLGIVPPSLEPRATDHIENIIQMIETLIKKGFAYKAENNDVYYSVSKFEGYGKLSGRNLEDLKAGERIAVDNAKQDPLDFVLWKSAKPDEPHWDSPWGKGRPGWHIECSAMSTHHLGSTFDIHGGGHDLQFPHHENEIAQSEACTGEHFANYWMHNGFIRVNEEKMSKSLGNFFTIRDVLKSYKGEEIRYYILTSQYRSPLNYSTEQLDSAHSSLDRLYTSVRELNLDNAKPLAESEYEKQFHAAMQDDFNTPIALAALFDLARETNKLQQANDIPGALATGALLKQLANILGLLEQNAEDWFKGNTGEGGLSDTDIDSLVEQRTTAKHNKDWTEADRLRDALNEAGIIIEDNLGKTTWKRS
ncbi:MAG: Cysteinyl-tRNA synthetase (EC [uncultured Thiotrichaceae bacterium]|uniref:Cysteine--tRNA ligase n=1 Tax=uncultured Thiotrichaceae bacterium TaxID=298394 RepID=A0A6S6RZD6_9GAMM|nr:MAG: Cysteinyl-tRNA synthetase (EC [uncultured Thiotrichaceae bacterium]